MGSRNVTLWFAGLFIPLLGTCHCTMVVRYYNLDFPNYRMSQWSMAFQNTPLTRCFARCSENITCYSVSYDNVNRDCRLSHWSAPLSDRIVAEGWSLFKLDPPCPDIDDFMTISNHSVAICSQRLNKTEAESACASFGMARLIEIRTEEMFYEIAGYFLALSTELQYLYGNIWVAGEFEGVYNNGTWSFPDGSLLPLTANTTGDADGSLHHMALDRYMSYKFNDYGYRDDYRSYYSFYYFGPYFSYMCERI